MNDKPPVGFFQAIIAVLWAFVGLRRGRESLADQGVKPLHFVVAGVVALAGFVLILNVIVRLIIKAVVG
jgi:hypothetical protein